MGSNVFLTGGGANTYTWSGGVTNGASFSPTLTNSYSVSGTNTLTGCISTNIALVTFTVNALPIVSITVSNPVICEGTTLTLNGVNADIYTRTNGDTNGLAFTPTASATYDVTGTNTLTGCVNYATQGVAVNTLPSLTVSSSNSAICFGQSITLSAQGANTYTWTNGVLNIVPFIRSISTAFSVTGTNTITGCAKTATVFVTVNQLPIITSSASSSSFCIGGTVTLNAAGVSSYVWTQGVLNGIAFSPSVTTTYSVTGTNTVTGCTSTNSVFQTITVNALPFLVAFASGSVICVGEPAILNVNGASTYSWSTNQTTSLINVSPTITTTFTVWGTDSNGCKSSTVLIQEVSDCVGINSQIDKRAQTLRVYPNPTNGSFFISTERQMNLTFLNELGQVVKVISVEGNNKENYLVTDLPNGIYFFVWGSRSLDCQIKSGGCEIKKSADKHAPAD